MSDGAKDFEFYHGRWKTRHRKLRDVLDPACEEWVEFEGVNDCRPIFGGLGNVEDSHFEFEKPFEGFTLRLYNPETGLWRIWWASDRQPGEMGPPVEGGFKDGVGTFLADEELNGLMTKVRFEWTVIDADTKHWQQSFSYDEGQTWRANWTTISKRES